VEISGTMAVQAGLNFSYRAPRVEVVSYAGPAAPLRRLDAAAPMEIYRFALEHFAAVSASSVVIPSLVATMKPATTGGAAGTGDYNYTGLSLREIRGGRIATIGVDRVALNVVIETAGKQETMSGTVEKLAAHDFDSAGAVAMLDPARAKDDQVMRVYRQMTAGSYAATFGAGMRMRLEGVTADEIGVRPVQAAIRHPDGDRQCRPAARLDADAGAAPRPARERRGTLRGDLSRRRRDTRRVDRDARRAVPAGGRTSRQARQRQARRVRAGRPRCALTAGAGERSAASPSSRSISRT
jgi:hypothetical protein